MDESRADGVASIKASDENPDDPGVPSPWKEALRPLPSMVEWAGENKTGALVFAFGFVLFKVLVIARGDVPTALGILRTAGLTTVVVGGLLSGLPLLGLMMLAVTTYRARVGFWQDWTVFAVSLLVCLFLTPMGLTVIALFVGGVVRGLVAALGRAQQRSSRQGQAVRVRDLPPLRRLGFCLVAVVVAAVATIPAQQVLYAVWLPHEKITLVPPQRTKTGIVKTRTGYVLEVSDGWLSLLESGTRKIWVLPGNRVEARTVCRRAVDKTVVSQIWQGPSLWQFAGEHSRLLHHSGPPPLDTC